MKLNPLHVAARLVRLPLAIAGWAAGRLYRRVNRRWYEAQRRGAFVYYDGSSWRSVDPVEAWGRLSEEVGTDFGKAVQLVATPGPADATDEQRDEHNRTQIMNALKLADAAAKAFRVKPLSEDGGLGVAERVRLVVAFLEHMAAVTARNRGA